MLVNLTFRSVGGSNDGLVHKPHALVVPATRIVAIEETDQGTCVVIEGLRPTIVAESLEAVCSAVERALRSEDVIDVTGAA